MSGPRRRTVPGARRPRAPCCAALLALAALGWQCTESVQLGENFASVPGGAGSPGGAAGSGFVDGYPLDPPDGGLPVPVPSGVCEPVRCAGMERACGNCRDDDGDGLSDAADPECLGPCDDSEAELFTGESMRANPSCRSDCFFDLNVGAGDDGCGWSLRCDPLSPAGEGCAYDATEQRCQADARRTSACRQSCLPLTPNGCDCFGCCELPANSGNFVWLGSEGPQGSHCELGSSADPNVCRPCTPVPDCQNDCAPCELCLGKSALPASCGGAQLPECNPGVTPCDASDPGACGRLHYCITGCCVPLPR